MREQMHPCVKGCIRARTGASVRARVHPCANGCIRAQTDASVRKRMCERVHPCAHGCVHVWVFASDSTVREQVILVREQVATKGALQILILVCIWVIPVREQIVPVRDGVGQ